MLPTGGQEICCRYRLAYHHGSLDFVCGSVQFSSSVEQQVCLLAAVELEHARAVTLPSGTPVKPLSTPYPSPFTKVTHRKAYAKEYSIAA